MRRGKNHITGDVQMWVCEIDTSCTWCGQKPGGRCTTPSGQVTAEPHRDRYERWRLEMLKPRRYTLKSDDDRFGLTAGDVLVCKPYWLDPGCKLTVLYRESDGFDPQCNVYASEVKPVRGPAGAVRS